MERQLGATSQTEPVPRLAQAIDHFAVKILFSTTVTLSKGPLVGAMT